MIKLKKILLEAGNNTIKFDKTNIQTIIEYLEDAHVFPNHLLYRRVGGYNNDISVEIRDIRKDRQLRDTNEFAYEMGNAVVNFYGNKFVPNRRESLYAYSVDDIDASYGEDLVVVFPDNRCDIYYHQNVKDSYMAYNIKHLNLAKNGEYLLFTRKNKLMQLSRFLVAYKNYEKYGEIDDGYGYDEIQKKILLINFDKMKKEMIIAKIIIDKLAKKMETGELKYNVKNTKMLEFKILMQAIEEFITNMIRYKDGLKILKNGEIFPAGEFELVIIGDEYLIAEAELFKNTFEWSNKLRKWVPKKGRV